MAKRNAPTATSRPTADSTPTADASSTARWPTATRHIGLSLGADLCWPACYEDILAELDPVIPWNGERVRIDCERVTIEPFNLAQPCRYDVVLDRLTHWYTTSREWIKKAILMDGLYVLNNPWSVQSMEKHTSYAAMMHLGLPIPETWMVPPKAYTPSDDLRPTLHRYARLFDLGAVGRAIGYPLFMKPYDGGGWRGVTLVRNEAELRQRYEESGTQQMHLQRAVDGYDLFVRCVGLGPQTMLVRYDPDAPLHDRYTRDRDIVDEEEARLLRDMTLTINAFFGWDFNSCEALRAKGTWHPIDFANPCPDSQVTSLHYHFPWIVLANLRWSIFCAVTRRPMRRTLDWEPYYAIAAEQELSWREKLRAYGQLAEEHFDTDNFHAFCDEHLPDLHDVAWRYFASDRARNAIRAKVAALYPPHEVEAFTTLFWNRIQAWREDHPPSSPERP